MSKVILERRVEGGYRLYEHDEDERPPNWTLAVFYEHNYAAALTRAKLAYPDLVITGDA